MIRVGGRLGNTDTVCYTCRPIVAPNNHHVTNLIICHYHRVRHVGTTQVLAAIIRKFWVLKGGTPVRRVMRRWSATPEELDPVPRMNPCPRGFCCSVKLDSSYQVSKIAEIFWVNQQGALEKQLDPGW